MGARGIVPEEEGLVGLDGTVHEIDGPAYKFIIDIFHVGLGAGVHIRMWR